MTDDELAAKYREISQKLHEFTHSTGRVLMKVMIMLHGDREFIQEVYSIEPYPPLEIKCDWDVWFSDQRRLISFDGNQLPFRKDIALQSFFFGERCEGEYYNIMNGTPYIISRPQSLVQTIMLGS